MMTTHNTVPPGFTKRVGPKGRDVYDPNDYVRMIHKLFLEAFGPVQFMDQFDCVRPHLKNRFFLKLDIVDAFGSVQQADVTWETGVSFKYVERFFFHSNGGLIQGAPASPAIFQRYCEKVLDPRLREVCELCGFTYTRYVDDILISSPTRIKQFMRKPIWKIIRTVGFEVNDGKAELIDNKHQEIIFLGMRIIDGKTYCTEEHMKKIREAKPNSPSYRGLNEWGFRVLALGKGE